MNAMKKSIIILISFLMFSGLLITGCTKDKTIDVAGSGGGGSSLRTTIAGSVLDESGLPLSGVAVTAYGQTATTNLHGIFVLKNLYANKERCIVHFSKTGFFDRAHGFIASANKVSYLKIVLISNAALQSLSASAGGSVNLSNGATVQFQPNSFVNSSGTSYTGTVSIAVKHLSPDDVNFGMSIPGGDLLGKDISNKDVALYSYGMVGVQLKGSSGEPLQLALGTTAEITFPVAASQQGSAPATIPLWYFDETDFLWKEQGQAALSGTNYVGTVAHFSWWNCDYCGGRATIKGKVVDCNGVTVPNIVVTVNGYYTLTTDQNGEFESWAPAGMELTFHVLSSSNGGVILNSQVEHVAALTANQIFQVPDLVIPCPSRIAGNIKTCTGESTDGYASISNSTVFVYQYTLNGAFNLIAPTNTQFTLEASNFIEQHQQAVTAPGSGTLNVGNILLCDVIGVSGNHFTLNGGPFSNQVFNVSVTSGSGGHIDTSGFSGIYLESYGTSLPNYQISFQLQTQDSLVGYYSWSTKNAIYLSVSDGQNYYWLSSAPAQGSISLSQFGLVGGRIKGTYSGQANLSGTTSAISVTGSFDVLRTH